MGRRRRALSRARRAPAVQRALQDRAPARPPEGLPGALRQGPALPRGRSPRARPDRVPGGRAARLDQPVRPGRARPVAQRDRQGGPRGRPDVARGAQEEDPRPAGAAAGALAALEGADLARLPEAGVDLRHLPRARQGVRDQHPLRPGAQGPGSRHRAARRHRAERARDPDACRRALLQGGRRALDHHRRRQPAEPQELRGPGHPDLLPLERRGEGRPDAAAQPHRREEHRHQRGAERGDDPRHRRQGQGGGADDRGHRQVAVGGHRRRRADRGRHDPVARDRCRACRRTRSPSRSTSARTPRSGSPT